MPLDAWPGSSPTTHLVRDAVDAQTYRRVRPRYRPHVLGLKEQRRMRLGRDATLLFENYETALYQLHEVLRVEGHTPSHVRRQALEYAPLVPRGSELRATLLIDSECPTDGRRIAEAAAAGAITLGSRNTQTLGQPVSAGTDPAECVWYLRFGLGVDVRRAMSREPTGGALFVAVGGGKRHRVPDAVRAALVHDLDSPPMSTRLPDFVRTTHHPKGSTDGHTRSTTRP